eukprot:1721241-Pyramimonas_sp.AAC.1
MAAAGRVPKRIFWLARPGGYDAPGGSQPPGKRGPAELYRLGGAPRTRCPSPPRRCRRRAVGQPHAAASGWLTAPQQRRRRGRSRGGACTRRGTTTLASESDRKTVPLAPAAPARRRAGAREGLGRRARGRGLPPLPCSDGNFGRPLLRGLALARGRRF